MLNNHMVRKIGWKPTDDVTDIERPTERRCRRPPRNPSYRVRKNLQKKIQNRDPSENPKAENNLHKPVVPVNIRVQVSLKELISPELLVSAPPRRSKRLRGKALECAPEGVNVRSKSSVGVPKKKKTRPELLVSAPPRRSKRIRGKALECAPEGVNVHNNSSLGVPKKKKKRYNVQRKKKSSRNLTVSQRAMRRQYRFWIVETVKDRNSLFRAFAHQLYGKEDLHAFIREKCCRYFEMYRERFQATLGTDLSGFKQYLDGMRNRQLSGGNLEITAMSELYERPVEIYPQHRVPHINIPDSADDDTRLSPLRVTVDNDNYYNSIVTDDHEDKVFVCGAGVFEDATLFRHAMRVEHKFDIQKVPDDGNCHFSAFSHQVYGDPCFHKLIREKCSSYLELYANRFVLFIDTDTQYVDFKDYLAQMRTLGTWGDNLEIIALSELYQRPVEVYDQQTTPRNIFSDSVNYASVETPIRITYVHGRTHYDSVVSEDHCDTLLNKDDAGVFEDAVLMSLGF